MKTFFFLFAMMLFSINLYSAPPDSCLKVYNNYLDSTFVNPYLVKVDSCSDSPTFGEFYGKEFFRLKVEYNIIPRDFLAPEDTIIEYTWQDILPQYTDARNEFQQFEQMFGTFYFRDPYPNEPDTSQFIKRSLALRFDHYVNIDSAENALKSITCLKSAMFVGWFRYLTSVKESETQQTLLVYPNPAIDFIELMKSEEFISTEITIYDLYGRIVKQTSYNNSPINISALPSGTYVLRVNNSTYQFIKY